MQKTMLAAALAVTMGMGTAQAADLRTTGSLKDAPEYMPASTWTGFFFGAGGGGGALNHDLKGSADTKDWWSSSSVNAELNGIGGMGGFGTVQVGYDRQLDQHFVVGAFFDYDFDSIDSTASASLSQTTKKLAGKPDDDDRRFQRLRSLDRLLDRGRPRRLSRQLQHPGVWPGRLYRGELRHA